MHGNAKNLTDQCFGRLIALVPTKKRSGSFVVWQCLCVCGQTIPVSSGNLLNGHTKSCGCLSREKTKKRLTTHGKRHTTEYYVWDNMIQRCENPKNSAYHNYGGRGISVCDEWHKFENFFEDMGLRPEGKSLDRWPNNDGNYEPRNCRYATPEEQRQNRRPISHGPYKQFWFRAWHKDSMAQYLSNNQHEFARIYSLNHSAISMCLKGKQNTHRKWQFESIK